MSTETNITFDESKYKIKSRALLGVPEVPTAIRVLVSKGIVKNENQALVFILSFVVVLIVLSVVFVSKSITVPMAIPSPTLS